MYYKNISCSVKTFHGVTFNPGETQEVSNYINHPMMIPVSYPINTVATKQQKPSPDKSKSDPEVEVVVEEPKPQKLQVKNPPKEVKEQPKDTKEQSKNTKEPAKDVKDQPKEAVPVVVNPEPTQPESNQNNSN